MSNDSPQSDRPVEFTIEAMELGPMENFIYLLSDTQSQRVAVVDPAWDAQAVITQVKRSGRKITDILLTHSHFDHVNGVQEILAEYDAQTHILKPEALFWGEFQQSATQHHGGDTIQLGSTEIKILHTPGHTPGSACYQIGNNLIAGDTLFVFGCGRCDLAGGDPEVMFDTLRKIQTDLPADTVIHPGHNYAEKGTCTLQEQIDGNPFMHFSEKDAFVQYRMHDHDKVRSSPYQPVHKHSA